jgi:hypothetical protein
VIYYDNPGCHDTSDPLRAMARRLVETRGYLRDRNDTITELLDGLDRDRHARHGAWRRWRITARVASRAYALGITAGHGLTWNGHCRACLTGVRWRGRRPYLLGWTRERWVCLLIGRHRRRELPGADICAVCAPCHQCRSADPLHDAWQCELDADQAARVAAALANAGDTATTVVRATVDGPEEVVGIRTAVDGLVATPTRGAPGWTLTHIGTGHALVGGMCFDDLGAAQRAAERVAGFGDFTSDPRQWPPPQRDALVAELGDLQVAEMFERTSAYARHPADVVNPSPDKEVAGPAEVDPDRLGSDEPGLDEPARAAGARR